MPIMTEIEEMKKRLLRVDEEQKSSPPDNGALLKNSTLN